MANSFGEKLRSIRIDRNLSQQQLAQRLFVNRSSIANWENGRRVPDLILMTRLAKLLNVDISIFTDATDADALPEVIVVDDEPILLSGAINILSEALPAMTITGFLKASEAIDYAKETRIFLAFLDIELGKANGIDLCNTLLEINPTTNVIFLTSYPDYAVKAWTTAASGFLLKPLRLNDISEQLKKLRHPLKGVTP